MADNRRMLVDGYSAKPRPASTIGRLNNGLQPTGNLISRPPKGSQLPKGTQSTVKTPKKA